MSANLGKPVRKLRFRIPDLLILSAALHARALLIRDDALDAKVVVSILLEVGGAVQGEATATASTPVRKASTTGCRARAAAQDDGSTEPNSNTPARFSPISVNSAASVATTAGDCSWKPQPSCSPPARSASSSPASATKDSTTPAV